MRGLLGVLGVCAMGVVPMVGCSDTAGVCSGTVCPCTEEGIRAAIAAGGDDPYTFDCDGPTTVATGDKIVIDNDVILDGEGNLTVDADHLQRVFSVPKGVNAELHRLTATHGRGDHLEGGGVANEGTLSIRDCVISHNSAPGLRVPPGEEVGGGIRNAGQMTIINSTISENSADHTYGGGIYNRGEMTIINSTVSDNGAAIDGSGAVGGGIHNNRYGEMTIINSTVSENRVSGFGNASGGGISNGGTLTLTHSTVWGNTADPEERVDAIAVTSSSYIEIANTLIDGDCGVDIFLPPGAPDITSNGYNIESTGDTCGFDQSTDQVNVSADNLKLGPLQDNGGPTMTHALGAGSVAIDVIPEAECVDADGEQLTTDQRGYPRPAGTTDPKKCDVGAFEVQQHCFQDDECSPLICCHLGSPFEQGTCQTQSVCDELQGGA